MPIQVKRPTSNDQDDQHIHLSQKKGHELDKALDTILLKEKEALVQQKAKANSWNYIDLRTMLIEHEALQLLEENFCRQNRVISFYFIGSEIRLGAVDPSAPEIQKKAESLRQEYKAHVAVYMISEHSLELALQKYAEIPHIIASREGVELTAEAIKEAQKKVDSIKELSAAITAAPVSQIVTLIVSAAIKANASDIHVEAEADDIKVRLRVDGVLHDIGVLDKSAWGKIVSRLKLIAGLKLNVFDRPQDGRFSIFLDQDKIEVRVSSVPTAYGESVVMRLLRFSVANLAFDHLGITGYTNQILSKEMSKPNGMIITTGPTGSGKTTTLYSIIHQLNKPGVKISALEDPIEYKIKGINQTQINNSVKFGFAQGLRSVMRQDPDVIMVGEIRDLETAETAINAALTGHLMLSTLHTNSAAGAIPRFLAMGAKNFLLAPSINAIIGQRLVRRLCPDCKKPGALDAETVNFIKKHLGVLAPQHKPAGLNLEQPETMTFYLPTGCKQCNDIGYRGRIGIFEILTMSKELEKLILSSTISEYDIQEIGISHGMVTMIQDGLLKALEGATSIEEIIRQTKETD